MNTEKLETQPGHSTVDVTADGRVLLVHFYGDEMESAVVFFTPAKAAKLGQRLLDMAYRVELP